MIDSSVKRAAKSRDANPTVSRSLDSVDLLKFAMSLVIVAIHAGLGGEWRLSWIYPLARLAVPVFFLLTSFFFFRRYELEDAVGKSFRLKRFVVRNMKLYCFWFIVLFVPTAVVRGWFTKCFLVGILSILRGFLFGSTFIASWYITASVIAVLIVVMCSGRMPEWSLCLLSLCCYVLAVSSSNYGNLFASWPEITALANRLFPIFGVPYNNFVVALFWVSLGRLLAVHQSALGLADDTKEGDGVVRWAIVAAFVVGAALLFFEQRLINEFALAYANDCYLCLPLPAAALVLITLRKRCSLQFAKVLRSASTVTYCLHGTLVSVLRYVATRAFPQFLDDQRILLFVVTLLICWVATAVILKLEESPKLHFLKYSH